MEKIWNHGCYVGDNMPSSSCYYELQKSLYDSEGEPADQEECVCTFLIIDDRILRPSGLPYVDVVSMASLGKLNCHNVSIFASICLEISWTFSESTGVLVQNPFCYFALIYLLKLLCFDLCNTDKTETDT